MIRIFRNTIAAAAIALTAAMPVAAQAGQDEEIFALGALAGVAGAVLLGGTVAGALALDNRADSIDAGTQPLAIGNDHVSYCQARYKTYRVSDNTFQPNNGPRRACVSPVSN